MFKQGISNHPYTYFDFMCNVTRKDDPLDGDLNINVQIDWSALDSVDKGLFWDYTSDNGWDYIKEDHRANGGVP